MTTELATTYEPKEVEDAITQRWLAADTFHAAGEDGRPAYCIVIPPPNVTAPLHLGHGLNNTLQDILIRYKRMAQYNTLWMPGTDHAGIATQTVVEKRIQIEEGKRRTDFAREEFVARVQAWKDEYEERIITQLRLMGCSCDWERTRFTMDDVCARAVRTTFFRLFQDGLIYRGKRLVNWDPATQTVLADDEVEHEDVQGHFWYMQYPLVEPVVLPCSTGVPPVCTMGVSPMADLPIDRRHAARLPHWTQQGATYAVTFRLADSVPTRVLKAWMAEREEIIQRAKTQSRNLTYQERVELDRLYSARIDSFLNSGQGECHLMDSRIGGMVDTALRHFDGDRYELIAWCVMPNHVHVVLRPLGEHDLSGILHSWKSFTSKEANRILEREGQFWQEEYYDHLIRDEEDFHRGVQYVLDNPRTAGLADWPWIGCQCPAGQDGQQDHGRDARGTHGQDARATVITHVTVATTRPETMLGDTAVAMNPSDPRATAMVGKSVRLPIVGRIIPIVADEHVVLPDPESEDEKAKFSTGFLKVTPAHDPDDWQIGLRHNLPVINVMAPDGSISQRYGWEDWDEIQNPDVEKLIGQDRFAARQAVVEFFQAHNLMEDIRDYTHPVGHSYRSHVPIEPYLSDQWYVAVKQPIAHLAGKVGEERIEGTDVPRNSLAGLALQPVMDGRVTFTPARYAKTYQTWLENLRDWPISRQLWWGHQIPVWSRRGEPLSPDAADAIRQAAQTDGAPLPDALADLLPAGHEAEKISLRFQVDDEECGVLYVTVAAGCEEQEQLLEANGFQRDPDVLDTWFSSALWPFSTLGWPEATPESKTFYPGDVLCTAREIITLWVSRMVMMGQYCVGDIPFTDVFIHAMIQDGEGQKMSKSLGNWVDPVDIIHSHGSDAMRFTLTSMTTQTQDLRMPVDLVSPYTGESFAPKMIGSKKAGYRVAAPIQSCPSDKSKKMVTGYGVASGEAEPTDEMPLARNTSSKFDYGRNFCNKLWNASRFAMMNLRGAPAWAQIQPTAKLADAWILSRLSTTVQQATASLDGFRFNELADTLYHFMWDELCDWYLEIAKARINAGEDTPKAVLAHCLDTYLRMLHPICPFITEAIWEKLNETVPTRGPGDQPAEAMLATARWPQADARVRNEAAEGRFDLLADLVRQVRNARTEHSVAPSKTVDAIVVAPVELADVIADNAGLLQSLAGLGEVTVRREAVEPPSTAAAISAGAVQMYVLDIIDREAEVARLTKQAETIRRGLAGIEGKLANEKFVSRAPAEVVERERERQQSLQAELEAVTKALAALTS